MNKHEAKERKETDALRAEALRLGIPIPNDPDWWWVDSDVARDVPDVQWELIKSDYEYLTDIGKAGTKRLIREEMRKDEAWRRQGVQWKLGIAGMIVSWVFGLLGLLIGVLSFLRK